MNFMGNIRGGGSEEKKEENEQPPITIAPLLLSSPSSFHHHHHEPFFSPPRYNHLYSGGENEESSCFNLVEREYMFDKVVTPSDVGKLNRLVIPKQHAERYFPLDSSTNYKGLLLNFEDRNGKLWRFQYSYWNSSQSYVMTKGWSRFVKEKKLHAGDIVSFQRGVGVTAKDRLFIDWRRRVNPNTPPCNLSVSSDLSFLFKNHNFIHPVVLQSLPARRNPNFMLQAPINGNPNCTSCSRSVGFGTHQQQFGLGFDHNLPPPVVPVSADHHSTDLTPILVDHGKVSVKRRLRLFGVNMDCVFSEEDGADENATAANGTIDPLISSSSSSFSTIPYLQLRPSYGEESECDQSAILSKSTVSNMSLDLKM